MAQQNTLDFVVAAHTKGMEQIAELINRVGALEAATASLQVETKKLSAAQDALGKSTERVAKNGKTYNNALDAQSKALRQSRQGTQMAMMQFNDFATSVSTGADPVMAFNQQIGQLGWSLSLMQGGLGRFGKMLSGPVGIAIILATSLLGAFREEIFKTDNKSIDFAKTANDAFSSIAKNIEDGLQPAIERLGPVIEAVTHLWEVMKEIAVAVVQGIVMLLNRLIGGLIGAINAVVILFSNSMNIIKEIGVGTANLAAKTINYVIGGVESFINNSKDVANTFLQYIGSSFRFARTEFARMNEVTNQWAGSTSRAFDEAGNAFMKAFRTDYINLGDMSVSYKADEGKPGKGGKSATDAAKKEAERLAKIQEAINIRNAKSKIFWAEYWSDREDEIAQGQIDAMRDRAREIGYIGEETGAIVAKQVDEPLAQLQQSFDAIGNSVSDAFRGMITGATSWKDGMRSIIGSVIDELWRLYVVQQIVGFAKTALKAIGLPLPEPKAVGGYVGAQKPYLVGEKGPELFIPGGSGTIIPSKNMTMGSGGGGGVTVNVDARGSADPAAVRAQVEQGIIQAAPAIIAAAQQRTVAGLRRPKLGGAIQ